MDLALYLVIGCLIILIQSEAVEIGSFAEDVLLPFWPPLGERGGGERYNLPIGQECHIDIRFQIFKPIIGEGIVERSPELNFASKKGERWHLAKS